MTGRPSKLGMMALGLLAVAAVAAIALASPPAGAQTDPPAFGIGDWRVDDVTVIEDRSIILDGNLSVMAEGDLTLRNVTLLFKCRSGQGRSITVQGGGSLSVLSSTLGSTRLRAQWGFSVPEGSNLTILGSNIQECSMVSVGTTHAVIEGNTIEGGGVGIGIVNGAAPIRNCTFSGTVGISTAGTWVEDCTFAGHTHKGIVIVGGYPRISRCTFVDMYATGIYLSYHGAEVVDCTFEDSRRGIWTEEFCTPSRVENCTFERVEVAISIRGSIMEVVNGHFLNCSMAIDSREMSRINWTVTDEAIALGGPVSLSGEVVLTEGARLTCIDCIEFEQWNLEHDGRSISLAPGSVLKLVRTRLEPPEEDQLKPWIPGGCLPLVLQGEGATLSLQEVSRLDVSFPVRLGQLHCRDMRLTLGSWEVGHVEMVDTVLRVDPAPGSASLTINAMQGGPGGGEAGFLDGCHVEGISPNSSAGRPWLDLLGGRLVCHDSLFNLSGWLETGGVRLPTAQGGASLEAYWSVRVTVVWQSQVPIPSQAVEMEDAEGTLSGAVTGPTGKAVFRDVLTEEALASDVVRSLLPLTFRVNMSGLRGTSALEEVVGPVDVGVVVKDLVRPTLVVDQGRFLATNRSTVRVTGRASDAHSGLAFVEASLGKDVFTRVHVSPQDGGFSFDVEADDLYQTLMVRAYDRVGNFRAWALMIHFSQREPYLTVYEPANEAWVRSAVVMVVGETDPNSTVEVAGLLQHTENGSFRLFVPLVEGRNVLSLRSTDLAGNTNVTTLELFLDTRPPELTILEPMEPYQSTRNATEVIRGRAEPGCTVMINAVVLVPDVTGGFKARTSLDQGSTLYIVQAIDRAGNTAVAEIVFVLDSEPPELVVAFPPEDGLLTNRTTIAVELQTDIVTLLDGVPTGDVLTVNGMPVNVTEADVRFELELEEGDNDIVFRVADAAGNELVVVRMVRVDTSPPSLALFGELPVITTSPFMDLAGSTEPGSVVVVNGLTTLVDENGTFRKTVLLSSGTNRIVIVSKDGYGNRATRLVLVEMMPETPPPKESRTSLHPIMIGMTVAVLFVEGVAVGLYARRARRRPR